MKIRIIDAEEMGIRLNRKDGDIVEVYWDEANKVYQDKSHDYGYWVGWKDEFFEVLEEDSTEWSGEGLPPANEKIMIRGCSTGSLCEGVIDYIDSQHCIWHWFYEPSKRTMYNRTFEMEFKPIKSQEEIEKEREIEKLDFDLDEWFNNIVVCPDNTYDDLTLTQYLYNLGYRKTK